MCIFSSSWSKVEQAMYDDPIDEWQQWRVI